ncbi:hypothetical protein HN681_03330 [archaeon]|jgi:glycine/serine hydroxymethyltransferase|nr:hypothetical protein [archaeon]MBT3730896.1 hypothetical protein [archaeon]MBT4669865.1 hypothetical protein [archaeon]MBT5030017.1 hypothetical protein [archaeon]MBT5288118.1 hypothetical protein [archaeon]
MKEKLELRMSKLCGHKNVKITDRGNSAIFIALNIVKRISDRKKILIPKEGGWFSYKKYPKYFNFQTEEVETDRSLIDLEDLEEKSKDAAAIIFCSFGGYFVEQKLRQISEICKKNDCLVIEDASGAIGDEVLCNGKYSDIIVGSFGEWKPVNNGYGGWISCNENYFEKVSSALSLVRVYPKAYEEIFNALKKNKLKKLIELQMKVKADLKEFDVFHKNKRGVNVVVENNPKVIKYCKDKKYPYVECPKYIRVGEKAISIELKRLDL